MNTDSQLFWFALLISIAVNIYLIRLVAKAARERRPFKPSKCAKCGYDIRANIGGVCPECGEPVLPPQPLQRAITRCNFCGRSNRETGPPVMGADGHFICAQCVELCQSVILKNRDQAKNQK